EGIALLVQPGPIRHDALVAQAVLPRAAGAAGDGALVAAGVGGDDVAAGGAGGGAELRVGLGLAGGAASVVASADVVAGAGPAVGHPDLAAGVRRHHVAAARALVGAEGDVVLGLAADVGGGADAA